LGAERSQALELAVLLLLEKLTPTERAAYVLREAFDYPYAQIAEILQTGEANTRQLVTRARKHIADERRAPVTAEEQRRLFVAFIAAAQKGDLTALENILTADVVSYSDGGGAALAARIPVVGRERVAKFITAFSPHWWTGAAIALVEANSQPSMVVSREGSVLAVVTIDASADGINQIQWMMNPAKTAAWSASKRPGV
jgi:Sigma-70, region 4